jgi:hypothetical protein
VTVTVITEVLPAKWASCQPVRHSASSAGAAHNAARNPFGVREKCVEGFLANKQAYLALNIRIKQLLWSQLLRDRLIVA